MKDAHHRSAGYYTENSFNINEFIKLTRKRLILHLSPMHVTWKKMCRSMIWWHLRPIWQIPMNDGL